MLFDLVSKVGKLRHGAGMDIALPFITWGGDRAFRASFHAILAKIKAVARLPGDTCDALHLEQCHPPLCCPNRFASPFSLLEEKEINQTN